MRACPIYIAYRGFGGCRLGSAPGGPPGQSADLFIIAHALRENRNVKSTWLKSELQLERGAGGREDEEAQAAGPGGRRIQTSRQISGRAPFRVLSTWGRIADFRVFALIDSAFRFT